MENDTKCREYEKCFARSQSGGCSILSATYPREGMCPFRKPYPDITKGKIYPPKRKEREQI